MQTDKQKKLIEQYCTGEITGKQFTDAIDSSTSASNGAKPPVSRSATIYAVTGTFHGSLVEAHSEGEARRIFHRYYNGESITHVVERGYAALLA